MPAWNKKVQEWIKQDKLVVLGISQEQHLDRCQLFAQWHQFNWPIVHDPINSTHAKAVPLEIAIDEYGVVRAVRPNMDKVEEEFLNKTFTPEKNLTKEKAQKAVKPDLTELRKIAEQNNSPEAWRRLGDAIALWEDSSKITNAIDAYKKAIELDPNDGDAHFRLGVCYRIRYDSIQQEPSDFQSAINNWSTAREIEPNRYIWRRRIEQYGPRSTKPYPFYEWVQTAISDIKARGEKPVELLVLPTGSEIAGPEKNFDTAEQQVSPPDPQGKINRDKQKLIQVEVTTVPPIIKPQEVVRVHLTLRPDNKLRAHWNNEGEPLTLWVEPPSGWKIQPQSQTAPQGDKPETAESRHFEFEALAPEGASGTVELNVYVLYYVCEDVLGTCSYLRQDIPVTIKLN